MFQRKMNKFLFAFAVALIVTGLFIPTNGSLALAKEAKKWTISVLFPGVVDYFVAEKKGCDKAAKEFGAKLIYTDAEWDPAKQMAAVENMIVRKVDMIVMITVDAVAAEAAVPKAKAAGIPIMALCNSIGIDPEGSYPGVVTFVGQNNIKTGELGGMLMLMALGKKGGNVLMIEGSPGTPCQVLIHKGSVSVLERFPNIKILGPECATWSTEHGMKITEDYLQRKEKIDVIYCQGDQMAIGAAEAVKAAGLKGKITIITHDGSGRCMDAIRNGDIWCDTHMSGVEEGYVGIKTAVEYLEGKEVPRWVEIGHVPMWKSNVDEFEAEF